MPSLKQAIAKRLVRFLTQPQAGYQRLDLVSAEQLAGVVQTADIVLVEGDTRISTAIKYLTQSSWSHACLYVGQGGEAAATANLLEADLRAGVRLVSLQHYEGFNLRICRPVGLSEADKQELVQFARAKLGHQYDLRNVFDLVRYLIQKPAVPNRYRRAMLGLGSGEPTRAICSTLIAEAFQRAGYPILPLPGGDAGPGEDSAAGGGSGQIDATGSPCDAGPGEDSATGDGTGQIDATGSPCDLGQGGEVPQFYRRHFTHFTPRDFDLSPYFEVVKPTLVQGFDHRNFQFISERE